MAKKQPKTSPIHNPISVPMLSRLETAASTSWMGV